MSVKGNRNVQIGWKNFDEGKKEYIAIRKQRGGGTRNISVSKDASVSDILTVAKELFFENDESAFHGNIKNFRLSIGNFHGKELQAQDFNLTRYIEKHKLSKTFLYLLTKRKATVEELLDGLRKPLNSDDDDDDGDYGNNLNSGHDSSVTEITHVFDDKDEYSTDGEDFELVSKKPKRNHSRLSFFC